VAKVYTLKTTRTASRLGIDYSAHLNGEQRDVVFAPDGPLLVLAGAGTGKTRALTYRVARMIDQGVPPEGILLLTFTNRAAREMIGRVEELCGVDSRRVLGGTFHHVGNAILRRHAEAIGYGPNFTILDRDDAREVMSAAVLDAGVKVGKGRFPKPDVLLEIASYAINTQTPARDVIAKKAPRFFPLADDIAAVCRAYIERKASMNLMDFDDLLMNWKILLEEAGKVGDEVARSTTAILVDEYQDTNKLQGEIVDLMARFSKNVTVVGDDAQCIYGFRGAAVENMLEFEKRWADSKMLPLTVNYRSTPEILGLANASLARASAGFRKNLQPVRNSGPLPALVPCRDVFMQAEFTAQRILELRDEGVPLDDIAVLYRAHSHVMEVQVELTRRGIPFVVRSGLRFFEQAHIKDVLAHLKLVYNPDDELSFRRAAKLQEGVGNASADSLWHSLRAVYTGAFRALDEEALEKVDEAVGRRAKKGVRAFLKLMSELSRPDMRAQPGEMIRAILDELYSDYLMRNFPNGADRQDDVAQLADYAGGFTSLDELLNELALVTDFSAEEAVGADDPEERVTLSSVHQAKGLEWGRVFLVWMTEGRFPSDLALRETGGAEEERRLFYVASTRAKDELYLTHPQVHRSRDSSQVLMRRSRFIDELPEPKELPPNEAMEVGEVDGFYEVWTIHEEPIAGQGELPLGDEAQPETALLPDAIEPGGSDGSDAAGDERDA
jgi:DNA helicase-2/ATP-dependent DNA helicase PcrA